MENTDKTNLEKLKDLLQKTEQVRTKYEEKQNDELFNIFLALHRIDDEVRLHSRFIAYLLSPHSNHKKGSLFAKIFIEKTLNISNFDFKNYEVYPNEFNKSEYKEIDILLWDKTNQKAIIIENKTRYSTPDSNYTDKPKGYNGQLERYYTTIHQGKDVNGKDSIHCENPYVFYLSVDGKKPNDESLGFLKSKNIVSCIHYETDIIEWLNACIKELKSDQIMEATLKQYLKVVKIMTKTDIDIKERIELKDTISKDYKTAMYLVNNFNHIKWHTVDDFWLELKSKLEKEYKNVCLSNNYIDALNSITHHNKIKTIGISFEFKEGVNAYIVYDNKGLTFGVIGADFWEVSEKAKGINFIDFSNIETFALIDKDYMKSKIVPLIIKEIQQKIKEGFKNMKNA